MAWKQIKTRVFGKDLNREGSLSKRMLFTWCMLASTILYLVPQDSSNKLQLAFARAFHMPLSASRNLSLSAGTQQNLKDTVSRQEYEYLLHDYLMLKNQLEDQLNNLGFYNELNSYVGKDVDYILGYIIPASANVENSELTINCSGVKGLQKGQLVMARNLSIIGSISYIAPEMKIAKVKLITDPDSNIPVRIEGLKQRLWMKGKEGENTAKISNVSREEKITKGQRVFALRNADFTDSDRYIGTVSDYKSDDKNPLLLDITVQPAWKIEELYEVAIVIQTQQN